MVFGVVVGYLDNWGGEVGVGELVCFEGIGFVGGYGVVGGVWVRMEVSIWVVWGS